MIILGVIRVFLEFFFNHCLWSRPYSAYSVYSICYKGFDNVKEFCLLSPCNICTVSTANEKSGFLCQKIGQIAVR